MDLPSLAGGEEKALSLASPQAFVNISCRAKPRPLAAKVAESERRFDERSGDDLTGKSRRDSRLELVLPWAESFPLPGQVWRAPNETQFNALVELAFEHRCSLFSLCLFPLEFPSCLPF